MIWVMVIELVFQCLLLEKGVEQSHKMPTVVLTPYQVLKFQKSLFYIL